MILVSVLQIICLNNLLLINLNDYFRHKTTRQGSLKHKILS